jgi:hypothetical protein
MLRLELFFLFPGPPSPLAPTPTPPTQPMNGQSQEPCRWLDFELRVVRDGSATQVAQPDRGRRSTKGLPGAFFRSPWRAFSRGRTMGPRDSDLRRRRAGASVFTSRIASKLRNGGTMKWRIEFMRMIRTSQADRGKGSGARRRLGTDMWNHESFAWNAKSDNSVQCQWIHGSMRRVVAHATAREKKKSWYRATDLTKIEQREREKWEARKSPKY